MWYLLLTNLIIHNYYYRYGEHRKQVKNLINIGNYTEATTRLTEVVQEHDNYMSINSIPNDRSNFTSNENKSLHHALLHIEHIALEENQKLATINALDE